MADKYSENVIGKRFGRLIVVADVAKEDRKIPKVREVICRCDCGNTKRVRLNNIRSGNTKSCGCLEKELVHGRRRNYIGERFGRLTVMEELPSVRKNVRRFKCKCDCGNETIVCFNDLVRNMTRSCGCYRKEFHEKRMLKDIAGQTFGELTAIKRVKHVDENGRITHKWLFRCSCGREFEASKQNVIRGMTKSCGHIGKSEAEYKIFKWLNEHGISFDYEASFDDLRNPATNYKLKFDFRIYRNDGTFFILEHHGEQHFNECHMYFGYEQRTMTDSIKKNYCFENGIALYETRYDEDYITKLEDILTKELAITKGGEG